MSEEEFWSVHHFEAKSVMSTDQHCSIPGIVRNGAIVPQLNHPLPEGSYVETLVAASALPIEVVNEIAAWDQASDDAWQWIDEMESKGEGD